MNYQTPYYQDYLKSYQRKEEKQQEVLLPLVKRQTPEGKDFRIVIPENVEYIIRKFCAKAPNNEWSGTLFYTVEGDFEADRMVITCKDFFLMDLGSGAFTEFTEDGTAIDYMVQHPELLDCQMGLLHSHDQMATFFSSTDTSTLQSEGTDRNNFVSLIVNNAGTYTAAITRKTCYKETHNIDVVGTYPFFGTGEVHQTEVFHRQEETAKTIVEWFELTVEKVSVEFSEDEYDKRFREIEGKKREYNNMSRTYSPYKDMYDRYPGETFRHETPEPKKEPIKELPAKREEPETKQETKPAYNLLLDIEELDPESIAVARSTPILAYKLREFIVKVLTGCPIITKWINTGSIDNKLFQSIIQEFADLKYTPREYEAFVYSSLESMYESIEVADYFADHIVEDPAYSTYGLENIMLVKAIDMIGELETSAMVMSVVEAFKNFLVV